MAHDFPQDFDVEGYSFYLLGASDEVTERCAAELSCLYPKLDIAGCRNGYSKPPEEAKIISDINKFRANFVRGALGKPFKQDFAMRWSDRLGATWGITCGVCFDYITGHSKRATTWMQDVDIERLQRLLANPEQLFRRYFVTSRHVLWIASRTRKYGNLDAIFYQGVDFSH